MHPFMRAVLLGVGRENALMLNAKPQPPDIELGQTMDPGGGKGHAVIRAKGAGKAIFTEESLKDRAHAAPSGRQQAVTRQQVPSVLIGDRERIAVDPVARAKVPLEVRRPEVVRPS